MVDAGCCDCSSATVAHTSSWLWMGCTMCVQALMEHWGVFCGLWYMQNGWFVDLLGLTSYYLCACEALHWMSQEARFMYDLWYLMLFTFFFFVEKKIIAFIVFSLWKLKTSFLHIRTFWKMLKENLEVLLWVMHAKKLWKASTLAGASLES